MTPPARTSTLAAAYAGVIVMWSTAPLATGFLLNDEPLTPRIVGTRG